MKKDKVLYWSTTALLSALMLFSAFNYFTNPGMKLAFVHLGFPDYFRVELAVLKILGVLALVLPIIPKTVKEFAYFGFAITFVSAFIAHKSSGDAMSMAMAPVIFLVVLIVSYFYYQKLSFKK